MGVYQRIQRGAIEFTEPAGSLGFGVLEKIKNCSRGLSYRTKLPSALPRPLGRIPGFRLPAGTPDAANPRTPGAPGTRWIQCHGMHPEPAGSMCPLGAWAHLVDRGSRNPAGLGIPSGSDPAGAGFHNAGKTGKCDKVPFRARHRIFTFFLFDACFPQN